MEFYLQYLFQVLNIKTDNWASPAHLWTELWSYCEHTVILPQYKVVTGSGLLEERKLPCL